MVEVKFLKKKAITYKTLKPNYDVKASKNLELSKSNYFNYQFVSLVIDCNFMLCNIQTQ